MYCCKFFIIIIINTHTKNELHYFRVLYYTIFKVRDTINLPWARQKCRAKRSVFKRGGYNNACSTARFRGGSLPRFLFTIASIKRDLSAIINPRSGSQKIKEKERCGHKSLLPRPFLFFIQNFAILCIHRTPVKRSNSN